MYKKFRFVEKGLAGDVFYPDPKVGISPFSCGLYLFGLPSFIGQNEITYSLVSKGVVSLQPHYFGTYDSKDKFSPRTMLETSKVMQELCDRGYITPTGKPKYSLPSNIEICIGHSFGTLAALRTIQYLHSVKVLVLLAPTVHYRKSNPNYGNKADGFDILKSIKDGHPYTYRLAPTREWDTLMSGKDPLPKTSQKHPTLKHVIAVAGENDSYLDLPALKQNLEQLVVAYCGSGIQFSLITIPGGGHTLSYLVEAGKYFSLSETVSKYLAK